MKIFYGHLKAGKSRSEALKFARMNYPTASSGVSK
ncbi:MAG: CHAT domain-containing protein [Proteobacteria bacterium]|nr:CHAT domain-containing protein [Pseudomonadota bacterium]MBU4066757.1 CHAT domain-containing protein [Pseudomonadota bacterium]